MTAASGLALNTATLGHNLDGAGAGWSPEQTIDACAERGLGGLVFWRREIAGREVALGERVRATGMAVVGLCRAPYLVGHETPREPQAVMDGFMASIDAAAALGAPVLTIVAGGIEPDTKGPATSLRRLEERVAKGADYAAARGVRLALEPLNPVYGANRSCLTSVRDAIDICARIGAPNVGVAVDVYHVWWDTDLARQLQRPDCRIEGVHLCDWLHDTTDTLLDRGMMGDGVADIVGIRRAARDGGYTGISEVEIFSARTWWQRDPGLVLDTMIERFVSAC
jgi:sugar phosphate isomerase/epimerase